MTKKKAMVQSITLDDAASILAVHPRTILRAITNELNPYWAPGHNPDIPLMDVLMAFAIEQDDFIAVLNGEDEVFKRKDACQFVSDKYKPIKIRTFELRKYPPFFRFRSVVRYSRRMVESYHESHFA